MLAKKISSHFDIGGVYMLHRGTCALSSNHDYTRRLSRFLCFKGIPVSYSSQTFSKACTCHMWKKHQVWDFSEMVCYFMRFNWIFTRRDHLIIGLNWVYPRKDLEWCQTFTQALMCPRDKNFVEVDEKNLLGPRWNSPSFVSFGTEKKYNK